MQYAQANWAGAVGIGIASNNVEYFDEPALAVMRCALPSDQYHTGVLTVFTDPD